MSANTTTVPNHYYTAEDKSEYLEGIYDAQYKAQQAALDAAYSQQVSAYDRQEEKIPGLYQSAKNATGSDAEIARANLNQSIAASGLNTGAGGQAKLSQSNVLQGNLSALDKERASRLADLEAERSLALKQYQSGVAQAIAENEYSKAQALYNEAVRVDNSYTQAKSYYSSSPSHTPTPDPVTDPSPLAADVNNWLYVAGYGEVSYEEAEILEEMGLIKMEKKAVDGKPVYKQMNKVNYDTIYGVPR